MNRRKRVIINFHGIGEPPQHVPAAEHSYWCPLRLWPVFADGLAALTDHHEVAVEVTFDDGNLSDVEIALPSLVERDLTASFYVCAGRFDLPGYLSVEHLQEIEAAGMGIGSHGWAHVDLRRVSDAGMRREAIDSRIRIGEAVKQEVTAFAVPFGSYNRRVLRHLRDYRSVFTSDRSFAEPTDWLTPRYSYVQGWEPEEIGRIVAARESLAQSVRRRATLLYKRWR